MCHPFYTCIVDSDGDHDGQGSSEVAWNRRDPFDEGKDFSLYLPHDVSL